MTMAELVAIGLPKLPEGLFYRVVTDQWGFVYLETRKERRIGSKLLCSCRGIRWNKETAEETILRIHAKMLKEDTIAAERNKYWVAMSSLEGDHK